MISRTLKATFYKSMALPMRMNGWIWRNFRSPRGPIVKVHLGPGQQKYLDGWVTFLGLAGLLAFALGSFLTEYGGGRRQVEGTAADAAHLDPRVLARCILALYAITFVGYIALLAPLAQHPDLLAQHWAGSDRARHPRRCAIDSGAPWPRLAG